MIPRILGESQRAFVERALTTEGSISAYDCMYAGRYEDGAPFGITRLAAVIWTLRHEAGWDITEHAPAGQLATYVYRVEADVPAWARGWECSSCHGLPSSEPQELLGGMGFAICGTCGERKHFRRAA